MLGGSPLVSLIIYVNDLAESAAFYQQQLGLPQVDGPNGPPRFHAGQIDLQLESAEENEVLLPGRRDESSDVVFLVDDLEAVRKGLEERGVEFIRRRSYEVGLVTDFYDPNGHRLMLYQPSEESLSWPSADKIRWVWRTSGRGRSDLIGPPVESMFDVRPGGWKHGLRGKPLTYLFMFENDAAAAFDFYHSALGLRVLERTHCCNQSCPDEVEGIAKYDGGQILLATHHMHQSSVVMDDLGRPYSPREYNREHARGIAPVFEVRGIEEVVRGLSQRGISFESGIQHLPSGAFARFEDPFGHPFFLFERARSRGRVRDGPREVAKA